MSKVADEWVRRYAVEQGESSSNIVPTDPTSSGTVCDLPKGWAIPKRSNRRLSNLQKNFLNKLFDDGERTGSKVSAEHTLKLMREEFDPVHFLPLATIKNYFSRRTKAIREGRSIVGEVLPVLHTTTKKVPVLKEKEYTPREDEEVDMAVEGDEHIDDAVANEIEEQRSMAVSAILTQAENTPDLQPDDWIAVDMGATWYAGQFIKFDKEMEELEVNFLARSTSNEKWFVWPVLEPNGIEDKSWIDEKQVFYRLSEPKVGRRETLLFDEYNDVEKAFKNV